MTHRLPFAGLALALLVLAAGAPAQEADCGRWRTVFLDMAVRLITLESDGRRITFEAKLADTSERHAAGFQCATPEEIRWTLILFDFGEEIFTQFHMQNVPAPLDIAFIKADGRIFSILRMEPIATALYGPLGAFRYALEAPAGLLASHAVKAGEARLVSVTRLR